MNEPERIDITWSVPIEQNIRNIAGEEVWVTAGFTELHDEATARRFYEQYRDGPLPDHLRNPRLIRITREVIEP